MRFSDRSEVTLRRLATIYNEMMNVSTENKWTVGSVWRFDEVEVNRTVETFLAAKASKRRKLNCHLSTLDSHRLFLKSKFIAAFNDLHYRVRKPKKGKNSSAYELICGSDRYDRARVCSFGASFRWESGGTATLTYVCPHHSCTEIGQIRSKPLELLCASDASVNEAIAILKCRKKRCFEDTRAEIESKTKIAVSPKINTLKG